MAARILLGWRAVPSRYGWLSCPTMPVSAACGWAPARKRSLRQTQNACPSPRRAFDPSATLRGAALAMINLFAAVATAA